MSNDVQIIWGAFEAVRSMEDRFGDCIPYSVISQGFMWEGELIRFETRAKGIFKPRQMQRGVLSIKTTAPRGERLNIYNDQLSGEGFYQYSLQSGDPYGGGNKFLWESKDSKMPFIYFHAVSPGSYKAIWPCFVRYISPQEGYAVIDVGVQNTKFDMVSGRYIIPTEIESRYQVRESKTRLHQESFRQAILTAYSHRCAITGISEQRLIEAAHIVPDAEVKIQTVSCGIALSSIHHRAFDARLLGIDADYKVHISDRLKAFEDNRFAKESFINLDGRRLDLPKGDSHRPNRDYLARTFEQYVIASQ